ncbi:MAG: nicotinate (nicotinamide) nucleotide adenylyltransferase [Desulfobacteraceae bacterium]|jgi:nicotinate-nucleotide adenylyltransferase
MRVGLFGGTFNPIHCGHLHIAYEICAKFPLDRIYMIPCAIPPHKEVHGLADASDRLKMLRLALFDSPQLEVNDVELRRSGPSFTIDTIDYFISQNYAGDELFMLIGLDAFLELDAWKGYLKILRKIPLIILARSMAGNRDLSESKQLVEYFISSKLSERYKFDRHRNVYLHPFLQPVFDAMSLLPLEISSTSIRERVGKGQSIDALVPKKVADYIRSKGLYQ